MRFPGSSVKPIWSPDSGQIVFASNRSTAFDIFRMTVAGSQEPDRLHQSQGFSAPRHISHDGRWLMYTDLDSATKADLWLLPLQGEPKPQPFLVTDYAETDGMFSPDGRLVMYVSDESGAFEVYVRPFASPGGKWRISNGGGYQPRWRHDGRELFYFTAEGRLMSVAVTAGATFQPGVPTTLCMANCKFVSVFSNSKSC